MYNWDGSLRVVDFKPKEKKKKIKYCSEEKVHGCLSGLIEMLEVQSIKDKKEEAERKYNATYPLGYLTHLRVVNSPDDEVPF